jgi:hypothetical protein
MNDATYAEIVRRTLHPNPDDNDLLQRITTLEQIVLSHNTTIAALGKCIDSLVAIVDVINRRESVDLASRRRG